LIRKKQFEEEKREWDKTGLDETGVGDRVKSYWRHVRTRLYFTSASHIYALLNTLKLGVNSILVDEQEKEIHEKKLDDILRMDFMSNFVFRLFENLDVQEDNPNRFKLEIMINRGAATDENEIINVKSHTIPIMHSHFVDLNKQLNFNKLEKFFKSILEKKIPKTPQQLSELN
jgi:inositol hexakisphosphate/diphosphoinositol-pentakisphosphate kinase